MGLCKLQRGEHEVQQRGVKRLLHLTKQTPQQDPQSPTRLSSPTLLEGDPQGEGDTVLPGDGGMDPSVVRGDMSGYGGIPQGLVGVPPTAMYTPYGQPLTPYVFGHGHVGPRAGWSWGLTN